MTIQCMECGESVEAKRSSRKYCKSCLQKRNAAQAKANYIPSTRQRICIECDTTWTSGNGQGQRCPDCRERTKTQVHRDWADRNRERRKAYARENRHARRSSLKKYGLTLEQYDAMVAERQGRCDICPRVPKSLCVDHDHETGRVRGLLCSPCNRAIGQLGDTAESLARALAYLTKAAAL